MFIETGPNTIDSAVINQIEEPIEEFIERSVDEIEFCKKKQDTEKDKVIKIILRVRPQNDSEKCDPKHKVRGY